MKKRIKENIVHLLSESPATQNNNRARLPVSPLVERKYNERLADLADCVLIKGYGQRELDITLPLLTDAFAHMQEKIVTKNAKLEKIQPLLLRHFQDYLPRTEQLLSYFEKNSPEELGQIFRDAYKNANTEQEQNETMDRINLRRLALDYVTIHSNWEGFRGKTQIIEDYLPQLYALIGDRTIPDCIPVQIVRRFSRISVPRNIIRILSNIFTTFLDTNEQYRKNALGLYYGSVSHCLCPICEQTRHIAQTWGQIEEFDKIDRSMELACIEGLSFSNPESELATPVFYCSLNRVNCQHECTKDCPYRNDPSGKTIRTAFRLTYYMIEILSFFPLSARKQYNLDWDVFQITLAPSSADAIRYAEEFYNKQDSKP